jgi:septal ring factor EnvC (AmiA/AmiB activator)
MRDRVDDILDERDRLSKLNSRSKFYLEQLNKEASELQKQIDARVALMIAVRKEIKDRNEERQILLNELNELIRKNRRSP